jgi:hopanoid biosynthesis associated protein HpnK
VKKLIVTADDFGRCLPINEAVEDAHKSGILTSASLMVGGDAARDAVVRASLLPELAVGLHVTLVDGKPVLPPEQIPNLVTAQGRFRSDVALLGTRIYFDRGVQDQVRAEMRAQFERYRDFGLPLDHIDSHHHYHLHPTVYAILLELAVEFGAPAVRIPYEPGLGFLNRRATSRMRDKAVRAGFKVNDRVFGFANSGRMDAAHVAYCLDHLPDGVTELYCHPATRLWDDHPMPADYLCVEEYRALIDPEVIKKAGRAALTRFSDI